MTDLSIATWKRGMTQVITNGAVVAVTLLEIKPHQVFGLKTKEKHGYNAVCFSAGHEVPERKVKKPMLKQFQLKEIKPRERIFEVRLASDCQSFLMNSVDVNFDFLDLFIGAKVDVQGVSIGKGFAGVMKRWNFRGLEASHGVSITHRSGGSTGQRQDPGKVFKGKKMPGRYGADVTSVQNLDLVLFDKELNLIGVKGAVPGSEDGVVFVKMATKYSNNLMPTALNGLDIIYS